MIEAEKARRIMQLYERDYDNFLTKLRDKIASKKKTSGTNSKDTAQAAKTLDEAKAHKATHLAQKAKDLLDKNGGVEGAKHTIQNVMKYMKDDTPSDYSVNVGDSTAKKDEKPEKTIMGLPPIAVYAGGTVLFILAIWGLSKLTKKHQDEAIALQRNPSQIAH